MTGKEKLLLQILEHILDSNGRAIMLQSYIAEEGPLSEEAAKKVRTLLMKKMPDAPEAV